MNDALDATVLSTLLVVSIACSDSVTPTAPRPPPATASPSPTVPGSGFPPVSRPARVYAFSEAARPVADYTEESRFVLYDDRAFALQYAGLGAYAGTYTETNRVIVFNWEEWSRAGPWGATGTLNGDSLTVRYNLIMQLTDFDAVYVRMP